MTVVVTSRGATAIVGIGQTEFSKSSGRSELQLTAEATLAALDDAGLTTDDVDGMVTFTIDPTEDNDLMRTLGIPALGYSGRVPHGGGAAAGTILHAASAIAAGAADVVVCYRALNARSGRRFGRARATTEEPVRGTGWNHTNWMLPFGVMSPMATLSLNLLPYMEAARLHEPRLRRVLGRDPRLRVAQPERVVLREADHDRRSPELTVDRRAGAAPPRLLPGERRRRRGRRHERGSARATASRVARSCSAPRRRSATATWPTRCTPPRASGPTTSTPR